MDISKLILLQYNRTIKKISNKLEEKIKKGGDNKTIKGLQQILDVVDSENIIYSSNINMEDTLSGDVRYGRVFLKKNGHTYIGTWKPYNGSTVAASSLLSGVKAYDSNGNLITGTHTCESASSSKPYKLTVYNNCSGLKIVKGFSGTNNNLTPSYCEYGESYDIYVDLGDVVSIMFYNGVPKSENINAPLVRLYKNANTSIAGLDQDIITNAVVNSVKSWTPGNKLAFATYLFYYGANNTSITFN